MTDKEIIKGLKICNSNEKGCNECNYHTYYSAKCLGYLIKDSITLINKLKAEVEKVKAEAIKEFAERLKEQKYQSSEWSHGEHPFVVEEADIDDLVLEMTEVKENG